MKARNGFTLIELLLIILILGTLSSIVVPRMASATAKENKAKCECNWANLIRALALYAAKNDGVYPATQAAFNTGILNNPEYFPQGTPFCPYGMPYTYISTPGQETVIEHSH